MTMEVPEINNAAAAPSTGTPKPAMIAAENLTKFYGAVRAVDGMTFSVAEGEILGLLGPNGAGKTTTMRMLTGFTPPTSGRAMAAGFDMSKDSARARERLGYLPESAPLYLEMQVRSYLKFMAELKRIPSAKRRASVDEALQECGLEKVAKRVIGNLSKGYRQRVGLAQSLLGDPDVLILDEPTVGLDPGQIAEIRQLIRSMSGHRSVILSTHILPEVSMTCDRVVIVNAGRVEAEGEPHKLTSSFDGAGVIRATVGGAPEAIEACIKAVTGVARTVNEESYENGAHTWRIETRLGADPRADLNAALVGAGFQVYDLHAEGLTLEDVFLRVISRQDGEE